MRRVAYLRDQARLCRELADRMSIHTDAQELRSMAAQYDHEADAVEGKNPEKATRAAANSDRNDAT